MNNVCLIARIARDLDLKTGEVSRLKFAVAFNHSKDKASFFECVAFKGTAENIHKFFKKGDLIGINGTLQENRWETDSGEKRSRVEIIVNSFSFTGGKSERSQEHAETRAGSDSMESRIQNSGLAPKSGKDYSDIIDNDPMPF